MGMTEDIKNSMEVLYFYGISTAEYGKFVEQRNQEVKNDGN